MTPFRDDELDRLPVPPQVFAGFLASLMGKVSVNGSAQPVIERPSLEEEDVTAFI